MRGEQGSFPSFRNTHEMLHRRGSFSLRQKTSQVLISEKELPVASDLDRDAAGCAPRLRLPRASDGSELQAPRTSARLRALARTQGALCGLAGQRRAPKPVPLRQLPLGWHPSSCRLSFQPGVQWLCDSWLCQAYAGLGPGLSHGRQGGGVGEQGVWSEAQSLPSPTTWARGEKLLHKLES